MEELLQLHVVIPEDVPDGVEAEVQGGFDEVHDLVAAEFPVPNKDVPTYDPLGMTVTSALFERRNDNLEQVDAIETQLEQWYPNASIFRSSYEQTFGEFRTPSDPDRHIMLLVTNWGIQNPEIRWKQQKETLQAPPLAFDNEVIHANHDGIFSIDSDSGDINWEVDYTAVQVPVGNDHLIIGNTGHELIGIDRATGEVQWEAEFEISEDEIIDSGVALASDEAYVGLRNGKVIAVSLDTGNRSELCSFDESVVRLHMIEPGLIAVTSGGEVHLVNSSGVAEWPGGVDITPSAIYSDDEHLYVSTKGSLHAISEKDGSVEWEVDFPAVNGMVKHTGTLFATTTTGIVGVNAETGDQVWSKDIANNFSTALNPVENNGVVACITSNKEIDENGYSITRNNLQIFDPSDGTELQSFELGVGDCYGPSTVGNAIVCNAGGEMICLDNFPGIE